MAIPIEKKFEIIDDYRAGISDIEVLSFRHGVPADLVEELIEELKNQRAQHRPNIEILQSNIIRLQSLMDLAEWEYKTSPDVDNATALATLISTTHSLIKDIEARDDPADALNQILVEAVQPMFRKMIRIISDSLRRINERLKDAVPDRHHGRIDAALKDAMRDVGGDANDLYREFTASLAHAMGCQPEDEKVKPMLKAVGSSDEKKAASNN